MLQRARKAGRSARATVLGMICGLLLGGCAYFGGDPGPIYFPSEVDVAPVVVAQEAPSFPSGSRTFGASVRVSISFIVDETGAVGSEEVLRPKGRDYPDPAFEQAALAAVSRWRFKPGMKGGVPVKVAMEVPIEFRPSRS